MTKHINMSALKITTEKAASIVGILSLLHPRPFGLETGSIKKLSNAPSYQPVDEGYADMVDNNGIYAL